MADTPFSTLAEAASNLAQSKLARALLFLFIAVELVNFGILPAARQTVDTWTIHAKSETEGSKATVAKRLQDALARKEAGEARHKEEIARNSPTVLGAKSAVADKQAAIDREKAKHADRRAAAEARKNAAEAEVNEIQAAVTAATARATFVRDRADAIHACFKSMMLETQDPRGLAGAIVTSPFASGVSRAQREAFSAVRKRCVPEDDTPPPQLHPLRTR